jgi:hypothetical protein
MNSDFYKLNSIISDARLGRKRENPRLHDTSVNRKDLVAQATDGFDGFCRDKDKESRKNNLQLVAGFPKV